MKMSHVAVTHLSKVTFKARFFAPPRHSMDEISEMLDQVIGAGAGMVLVNLNIKKINSAGLGLIVSIVHRCRKAGVKVACYSDYDWVREILMVRGPLEIFFSSESDAMEYLAPGWNW